MRGQMRLGPGQRVNIRLEYIEQTGPASVRLEWSAASRAGEVIPMVRLYPARVDKAGGSLLKEHWSGMAGGSNSTLIYEVTAPITLGADTTFSATASGRFHFSGDLSGPGGLTRTSSSSTLVLSATNTYTGDTIITAGTLQIGNDIAPIATSRNLRLLGAGNGVVTGTIADGPPGTVLVSIAKADAGTWSLNGPVAHTGSIAVSAGTLLINGPASAAIAVTVAAGGTLGEAVASMHRRPLPAITRRAMPPPPSRRLPRA